VTDVGVVLAHGSIVAYEYGIFAVLGSGVANRRIRSGQRIHVDGDTGTVTLLLDRTDDTVAERPSPVSETDTSSNARTALLLALARLPYRSFSVLRLAWRSFSIVQGYSDGTQHT
jgi:phosphoenolpyruvate-protein kinase (PTS system EI component)